MPKEDTSGHHFVPFVTDVKTDRICLQRMLSKASSPNMTHRITPLTTVSTDVIWTLSSARQKVRETSS